MLECGATKHRADKKKPCGLSCLWRCCGCRKGGMSDCQPTWRGVKGTPGWGCGWRFLGIRAWFAAWLVLYFGNAAALAQPPMPQQPVCPRKVLWTQKLDGVNHLENLLGRNPIQTNKPRRAWFTYTKYSNVGANHSIVMCKEINNCIAYFRYLGNTLGNWWNVTPGWIFLV